MAQYPHSKPRPTPGTPFSLPLMPAGAVSVHSSSQGSSWGPGSHDLRLPLDPDLRPCRPPRLAPFLPSVLAETVCLALWNHRPTRSLAPPQQSPWGKLRPRPDVWMVHGHTAWGQLQFLKVAPAGPASPAHYMHAHTCVHTLPRARAASLLLAPHRLQTFVALSAPAPTVMA